MLLAHGVGQVYELPIPLWAYLLGAAATVAASFVIRALAKEETPRRAERRLLGPRVAGGAILVLRVIGLAGLLLALLSGLLVREDGITFTSLLFWVAGIVGITLLSAVMAGSWEAIDPWASIERFYRLEEAEDDETGLTPSWWLGPLLVFVLFWFELASGVGFDSLWVTVALIVYTLFVFSLRARFGEHWERVDPLSIVFGFAARSAPLRLTPGGLFAKGFVSDLDDERPMPLALYASVFVMLGATTYDNLGETVGYSSFMRATDLRELPDVLPATLSLLVLIVPFWLTFMAAVLAARRWLGGRRSTQEVARYFGWALVPIAIAYVLAHNAPLVMTGFPELLRRFSDPIHQGWDLFGTSGALLSYVPSPRFVWFVEIFLIVGGHIVAVLAGHRIAVRLTTSSSAAVKSQYALTVLMTVYTITTLWLLAQPLVA